MCKIRGNHIEKALLITVLFTFFCLSSISAQEKTGLVTETIQLTNTKNSLTKKDIFVKELFQPLLSKNGKIEFDVNAQKIVVTDKRNSVDLIKNITQSIENSGLSFGQLSKNDNKKIERITRTVGISFLPSGLICDVGEEEKIAKLQLRQNLLIELIKKIKVGAEPFKNDLLENNLKLTGTEKRVELAKNITKLFNETILLEDF
ncbi:MAG TPA: hypothetical protein PKY59_09335 [Pyrinomonadaceae bacterium]|nr:hypothetical protein [Pyrinomonadaceae bacterium]